MLQDIPDRRLYGAGIAIVSGLYSLTAGMNDTMAAMWFMMLLGFIVFLHGVLLLGSQHTMIREHSGDLMLLYAVLMLGNQARLAAMESSTLIGTQFDTGMVALATLMLVSGGIMRRSGM